MTISYCTVILLFKVDSKFTRRTVRGPSWIELCFGRVCTWGRVRVEVLGDSWFYNNNWNLHEVTKVIVGLSMTWWSIIRFWGNYLVFRSTHGFGPVCRSEVVVCIYIYIHSLKNHLASWSLPGLPSPVMPWKKMKDTPRLLNHWKHCEEVLDMVLSWLSQSVEDCQCHVSQTIRSKKSTAETVEPTVCVFSLVLILPLQDVCVCVCRYTGWWFATFFNFSIYSE